MKMMNNHVNLRTCVVTKVILDKKKLIRVVLSPNKQTVQLDLSQNLLGRGLYFQNKTDVIDKLIQKKLINKVFKIQLDDRWYLNFKNQISKIK